MAPPNTEPSKRVMRKAGLLPYKSDMMPQKSAPTIIPVNVKDVANPDFQS